MNKYLLIFLMLAGANAFGAVNKWVDSKDRVHYSDQPPPPDAKASSPAKTKTPLPASDSEDSAGKSGTVPASAPAAPKTIAEREAELKKSQQAKKEAADKAAQKQANEEVVKANCAVAQQNLRALQDGARMVEIDASGERSYLDDNQRQQRTAKAQQDISAYCK